MCTLPRLSRRVYDKIKTKAMSGDTFGQLWLGHLYLRVKSPFFKRSPTAGRKWLLKAAESGSIEAHSALSIMNMDKPFDLPHLQTAVDRLHCVALTNMASLCADGAQEGVPKNLQKAELYLQQAADRGFAEAQYNLSQMYGSQEKWKQALKYARLGAQQHFHPAQYTLGVWVEEDGMVTEAKGWFEKAAKQGNAEAKAHLKACR